MLIFHSDTMINGGSPKNYIYVDTIPTGVDEARLLRLYAMPDNWKFAASLLLPYVKWNHMQ